MLTLQRSGQSLTLDYRGTCRAVTRLSKYFVSPLPSLLLPLDSPVSLLFSCFESSSGLSSRRELLRDCEDERFEPTNRSSKDALAKGSRIFRTSCMNHMKNSLWESSKLKARATSLVKNGFSIQP